MNEEKKTDNCLNLDIDISTPSGRGAVYGYTARIPLDIALIVKIIQSNMRGGWKWIGCTCAVTDMVLCGNAARVNLPKLMKK